MKQLKSYSLHTGLRIGKMQLEDQFYPLPFSGPYILVSSGCGAPGNSYGWYRIVVDFIKPIAAINGYTIVQCGGKDDYRVNADVDLCGRTTQYQYNWLAKNAGLVICNDTSLLHIAGHYDRKIVATFGISHPETSGAYYGRPENQTYILPPQPWTPCYSLEENPKSIDKIKPEEILRAVNELMNWNIKLPQTLNIGTDYNFHVLETIPNAIIRPDFLKEHPLNIRLDKGGNINTALQQLQVRKCTLITNQVIPMGPLQQLRPHLESVTYIVEKNNNPQFAKELLRNAIPHTLCSFLTKEELEPIRFDYVDLNFLDRREKTTRLDVDIEGAKFKTNKRIFSDGKVYLSYAHLNQDKNIDNFAKNEDTLIDSPDFWEDQGFHYIYR